MSVIMPFYDAEQFLAEALQSVFEQTYRPFELLLVDDCSRDNGSQVAERAAGLHPELRLFRTPENQGPAAARNLGLANARGHYITFLDSDDVMVSQRLAMQVHHLTDHPDVDVVIAAEESIVEPHAPMDLINRRRSREPGMPFLLMSMMVRRPALDLVGGFDPSYAVAEDIDWLFRAAAAGLVVDKILTVLTLHRLHTRNLSFRTRDIQTSMIRSLRNQLGEGQP